MSVFTMVAIIVVTSILAKSWVAVRKPNADADELERLRLENQELRERVGRLENHLQEMPLLEDLSGDRALADEIERAARSGGVDGSVERRRQRAVR